MTSLNAFVLGVALTSMLFALPIVYHLYRRRVETPEQQRQRGRRKVYEGSADCWEASQRERHCAPGERE